MNWFKSFFNPKNDSATAPEDADRKRYAKEVSGILRRLGLTVEINESEFALVGAHWRWNLENLYQEYFRCEDTNRRSTILESQCKDFFAQTQVPEYKFEEVRDQILPAVRERMTVIQTTLDFQPLKTLEDLVESRPVEAHKVFAEHFAVLIAVDGEHRISYLPNSMVTDWHRTMEELLLIGFENLRTKSKEKFIEIADGLYASCWRDNFDTSRILLVDKVRDECKVKGSHVAFLINRDTVLITGSDDVAGIKICLELYSEFEQLPRTMGLVPLVLVEDEWKPFTPNKHHRCYQEINNAHVVYRSQIYQLTQPKLVSILGEHTYVANQMIFKIPESGTYLSLTNWSCRSLLPKSDWISFVEVAQPEPINHGMVQWEEVSRSLGNKILKSIEYPPRVFVESFVEESDLKNLNLVHVLPPEQESDLEPHKARAYLEILTDARERFIAKYRRFCEEYKGQPQSAGAEIGLKPSEASQLMFEQMKVDYVLKFDDGPRAVVVVVPNVSIETTECRTAAGLRLVLKPLTWSSVIFKCSKFDVSAKSFHDWSLHWLDPDEKFQQDEFGLSGAIHCVTVPKADGDNCTFMVDFGSAPIEAFEELLNVLTEIGVTNVTIRSDWNTSPGSA